MLPDGMVFFNILPVQAMMDTNNDGLISYNELAAAVRECAATARAVAAKKSMELIKAMRQISELFRQQRVRGVCF